MKKLILISLVLIAFAQCKDDDCNCHEDADINQAWMDASIADIEKSDLKEYFYIARAEYECECVVFVGNGCPQCNSIIILYRCDGTKLDGADVTKIKNQTIVWTPM